MQKVCRMNRDIMRIPARERIREQVERNFACGRSTKLIRLDADFDEDTAKAGKQLRCFPVERVVSQKQFKTETDVF